MIKTKLAKKVLTKKEQRHLTEVAGINSMAALKRQIESQKKHDPEFPNRVCFECWKIAQKLNIIKDNKQETVELIASGYEWKCPNCKQINIEIEITNKVYCPNCWNTYTVDQENINHAFH